MRSTNLTSNTVRIKIGHRSVTALVDSGAAVSVISQALLTSLPAECVNKCDKEIPFIFTASGEAMPLTECVELTLNVNGLLLSHIFNVTPMLAACHSLILGFDLLTKFQCTIDIPNKTLYFCDGLTAVSVRDKPREQMILASLSKGVILPPRSETIMSLVVSKSLPKGAFVLEGSDSKAIDNVAVARAVVTPRDGTVLCRVLNPTNTSVKLRRKSVVATLEPVDNDNILPFDDSKIDETTPLATDHRGDSSTVRSANDVLNEVGIDLTNCELPPADKIAFGEFLAANRDVFAKDMSELGCTTAYTHDIDTGDSAPQRRRLYRHPPHIKKEIESQLDELISANILEPATTLWQSPVVIVLKSDKKSYRFCSDFRWSNQANQLQATGIRGYN